MAVKMRERPKGSGIWWVVIDYKRRRKSKKIGKNKTLAEKVAAQIEARLTLGDVGVMGSTNAPLFKDYADTWKSVMVPGTCKPSTQKSYKQILKAHVGPVFNKKPVTDITRLDVKNFLTKKIQAGAATSTVENMKAVISGVLNLALDENVLKANPAHRLGKVLKKKSVSRIDPLDREELAKLLDVFRGHYSKHYPMALTLSRTGERLGEVVAIQWRDIDFSGRFINIQRNFSLKTVQTPKSGKARRVDMSRQLAGVLSNLKHIRKIEAMKRGWGQVPEWVFINKNGKPVNPDNLRTRVFYKALEKAKLRKIRIHDLRHTYASLLIQASEPLPYIRDQLGHGSIQVTVDIYGHMGPQGNKEAVDRLDDDFGINRNTIPATTTAK